MVSTMSIKLFLVSILILQMIPAMAGLYSCNESSAEPTLVTSSSELNLSFSTTQPYLKSYHLDNERHKKKTPYLVYYVIDSSEAFMQYAVRFEVGKLQESCTQSNHVNFVAFINSLYLQKNEFIVCKNKQLKYINFERFPDLNDSLKAKKEFISSGDHAGSDDLGPLRYLVRYFDHSNEPFGRYPLAHPDFLFDLVNLAMTDEQLFPSKEYIPYINLKSHGSEDQVLAGMHSCQEKAKELSAQNVVKNLLDKTEVEFLNNTELSTNFASKLNDYEIIINKLQLGSSYGDRSYSNSLGEMMLGEMMLNFQKQGLGNIVQGLGVSQGLGIEYSFGSAHVNLTWVLGDLFDNETDRVLGFLMLESCETNRDPVLFHSYLNNVLGFYSAKESLWYRNLNWWTILEKAENSSVNLLNILKEETSKIPNIKVTSP